MADIGNRTYEIKADKDPIAYHNEYPVTCVSIDIPSWLMDGEQNSESESGLSIEQIWYPRKKTTASGWFFRFWSYKTLETSQSLGENQNDILRTGLTRRVPRSYQLGLLVHFGTLIN